jgi:acetyl esterase
VKGLKQPYRGLFGLFAVLHRFGIGEAPSSQVAANAAKRQLNKPPFWMTRPGDRSIRTHTVLVEGRGGPVQVRVFTRPDVQPGGGAIVYLHGGGFVVGGLDGCDYITRGLASRSGLPVFSVEYRLAPETPHPGPLQDCEDALRWVVETCPEGIDPTRIAIAGDSAGGNLTAALCLLMRDTGGPAIAHQTLVYPFTDATISSPDWDTYGTPAADRAAGEQMVRWYAPDHAVDEPYVSVLHAPSLEDLPPALVITAEFDVLHTDGVRYAERLMEAGVRVLYRDYPGVPHGFVTMPRLSKDGDQALDLMAVELSKALAPRVDQASTDS